jgi:transcriptional regulator with XRE-family HTH domain
MKWTFDFPKLITLRELKALSKKDCADAIGKTEESYRLKESGKSPLTVDEICAIANTFGVDPRSFFTQKSNGDKKAA